MNYIPLNRATIMCIIGAADTAEFCSLYFYRSCGTVLFTWIVKWN